MHALYSEQCGSHCIAVKHKIKREIMFRCVKIIKKKKKLTTKIGCPPSYWNAFHCACMSICRNGRAKTFTITSLITCTRIKYASFHEFVDIHLGMASSKYFTLQYAALFLGPNFPFAMHRTSIDLLNGF